MLSEGVEEGLWLGGVRIGCCTLYGGLLSTASPEKTGKTGRAGPVAHSVLRTYWVILGSTGLGTTQHHSWDLEILESWKHRGSGCWWLTGWLAGWLRCNQWLPVKSTHPDRRAGR